MPDHGTKFSGLTAESDPLLGNRLAIPGCPATDYFTMPRRRRRAAAGDGSAAVRVRARRCLFLYAGLCALRYLAGA